MRAWVCCVCVCVSLFCDSFVKILDAGLEDGVTDAGLSALASAGCGALLTSLTLSGE